MKEDFEKVWDYVISQEQYNIQELATSIIGIGALFFAYGTVPVGFLRNIIALIGLGASFVLWTHSWAARVDARSGRKYLSDHFRPSQVAGHVNKIQSWRSESYAKWLYHPVTRLAVYFQGLVAFAWVLILVNDLAGVGFKILLIPGFAATVGAALWAIYRRSQDHGLYDKEGRPL